ncbi:MAG: thymidylate synthase [Edaphocola sp.]
MNKYHQVLSKILSSGKWQENRKGNIKYLLNQKMELKPVDLLALFEGHPLAKKKLKDELQLFMQGERLTERYREKGVGWWDYCGPILVNSYPTYFEQLPDLIRKINMERRNSKNYVLFLGRNDTESNQQPCLSLIQFQVCNGKLALSAYQRSSDASLGLPSDIYHLYLIGRQIDVPLRSITLFLANVHIYENNIELAERLLGGEPVKFNLNVG